MNKLNIDNIKQERVQIEITDTEIGVELLFTGDIDMEDPSLVLDPFFDKVHQGAISNQLPEITVNFTELHFLNSSGIKAIAKWIMKLAMIPAEQKYTIRILHNKSTTWQVTSLPTLTFLVPGAVKVE